MKRARPKVLFGWAVYHPELGLTCNICGDERAAWEVAGDIAGNGGVPAAKEAGYSVVRVKVEALRK